MVRGRKLGAPVRPEDSPVIFAALILGETGLYKWQMRALERAARGKRVALRAANGSGKTDKVIGILALWFLWRYPRGRMPITSGSWRQVKNQLWPALERHRNNPSLAGWKWLKNCRVETPEGGFIEGFSTNHAGKAEGWHGRVTDEFKDERKGQEEEDPRNEVKARLFDADEFTGDDPSSPVFSWWMRQRQCLMKFLTPLNDVRFNSASTFHPQASRKGNFIAVSTRKKTSSVRWW